MVDTLVLEASAERCESSSLSWGTILKYILGTIFTMGADEKETSVLQYGALVQLVRILACHASGQGFESPTHRQFHARFVYRLGHCPFTAGRGVRFPYRVPIMLG